MILNGDETPGPQFLQSRILIIALHLVGLNQHLNQIILEFLKYILNKKKNAYIIFFKIPAVTLYRINIVTRKINMFVTVVTNLFRNAMSCCINITYNESITREEYHHLVTSRTILVIDSIVQIAPLSC